KIRSMVSLSRLPLPLLALTITATSACASAPINNVSAISSLEKDFNTVMVVLLKIPGSCQRCRGSRNYYPSGGWQQSLQVRAWLLGHHLCLRHCPGPHAALQISARCGCRSHNAGPE